MRILQFLINIIFINLTAVDINLTQVGSYLPHHLYAGYRRKQSSGGNQQALCQGSLAVSATHPHRHTLQTGCYAIPTSLPYLLPCLLSPFLTFSLPYLLPSLPSPFLTFSLTYLLPSLLSPLLTFSLPYLLPSLPSPFLTFSLPYLLPSLPSPLLTFSLPYFLPYLPSPFLTFSLPYLLPSLPSPFLTFSLPYLLPSLPSPFLTFSLPYLLPSLPSPFLTFSLPYLLPSLLSPFLTYLLPSLPYLSLRSFRTTPMMTKIGILTRLLECVWYCWPTVAEMMWLIRSSPLSAITSQIPTGRRGMRLSCLSARSLKDLPWR